MIIYKYTIQPVSALKARSTRSYASTISIYISLRSVTVVKVAARMR